MSDQRGQGGGPLRRAAPLARTWSDRLDDPDEPLYTIAVVAELLATDHQTLRRIESALDFTGSRPSGNQRRYSRNDLARLDEACSLNRQGLSPRSIAIVLGPAGPALAHRTAQGQLGPR